MYHSEIKESKILVGFLYNLSISFYQFIVWLASFFNSKASKMVIGRRNWADNLKNALQNNSQPLAWFHCASLGEFEQGRPLIEAFAEQFPNHKILLTFFSPSGYEIRKNYDKAHVIRYLPFDTFSNAKEFLEIVKPEIVLFVKYEFWHNLLFLLNQKKVPTYLISANFRQNQIFFKSYGGFFKETLQYFDHIFVQNEKSENLLQSINYQAITIAGDTRFDRVNDLVKSVKPIEIISTFKSNKKLFVIGSAWAADIDFLMDFLNDLKYDLKIIIAPHEIKYEEIENWQAKFTKKSVKYSDVLSNQGAVNEADILIIDNIGMLSSIYQYANFSWIGGAFEKGLHNILEAATFGMPIFFGNKNYQKFQEALDLANLGGAFPIGNFDDFSEKMNLFTSNDIIYDQICGITKSFVRNNIGATELIMKKISQTLIKN